MIRDISIALREGTPEWPGDTPFACRWASLIAKGETVNVSAVIGSPHVGTHADAPLHVHDGWPGSHELPLDAFVGRASVVDVSDQQLFARRVLGFEAGGKEAARSLVAVEERR